MGESTSLASILVFAVGLAGVTLSGAAFADNHGVTVTVKGESWDA